MSTSLDSTETQQYLWIAVLGTIVGMWLNLVLILLIVNNFL
jgi:hypothetical protein